MDINTRPGEKVIFKKLYVGVFAHQRIATKYLKFGGTYTVKDTFWDTDFYVVRFKEVPDIFFNGGHFENCK